MEDILTKIDMFVLKILSEGHSKGAPITQGFLPAQTTISPPKDMRFQTFKDMRYLEIAAEGGEKIFNHFSKRRSKTDVTPRKGGGRAIRKT